MKKTRNSLAFLLAILMLMSSVIISPVSASAATKIFGKSGVVTDGGFGGSVDYDFKISQKKKVTFNMKADDEVDFVLYQWITDSDGETDLKTVFYCRDVTTQVSKTCTLSPGSYTLNVYYYSGDIDESTSYEFSAYDTSTYATSIKLSKSSLSMKTGTSQTLKYTLAPANSVSGKITWTSSNSNIASVNSAGKVTAKKLGKVTIKAKLPNGKYSTCSVDVNKVGTVNVVRKWSKNLSTTVNNISGYKKAKWSSSNKNIATVTSAGKVSGKKNGSCNIYCKIGKKKYTFPVKVVNPISVLSTSVSDKRIYNDAYVKVKNNTGKKITHFNCQIYQYDNRGRKLKSPYSYFYSDDTFLAGDTEVYVWWVNDSTKKVKVKITKVWFSDGTTWKA